MVSRSAPGGSRASIWPRAASVRPSSPSGTAPSTRRSGRPARARSEPFRHPLPLERDGAGTGRAPRRTAAASAGACPGCRARRGRTPAAARSIAARSASENIHGIEHTLSTPIPCSPVSDPPASTHASRISAASCSARSASPCDRGVVEHERVQVAVAGVEHVPDPQAVRGRELLDPAQRLRKARARDDAVLDVVVGAHPAHGGEGGLAAVPERGPLGVVGRDPHLGGAAGRAQLLDAPAGQLDLDGRPVELDEQDGARIARKAGVDGVLGGLDRELRPSSRPPPGRCPRR